jgi:hypothetical protein
VTRPAFSLGARLDASAGNQDGWNASGSLSLNALLGTGSTGMSSAQLGVGGQVGHGRIAELSASAFVSAGRANGPYLGFAPIERAAIGYQAALHLNVLRQIGVPIRPYVMVHSNSGGFADTQYTIGFVVGGGVLSWLKPPR